MQMSSLVPVHALVALSALGFSMLMDSVPARAFEGANGAQSEKAPLQIFKNPQAALRAGLEGVRAGDAHSAVEALKYAAAGGESLAQWKLGKMYADGDGVPHDDVKAYEYFSQIVENFDEDSPNRRALPVVASAFVAVGVYSLNGIANTKVKPDPERALEMFQYAATNFGDANAQYNLARMYLDGAGVRKDGRQAARWLNLAADKGHSQAQALLGHVLFTGHDGLQRQRARGLMWLTLAREAALDSKKDQWIVDLYNEAMKNASDSDRQVALIYLEDHLKKRN
jgi:TPR repeat protein